MVVVSVQRSGPGLTWMVVLLQGKIEIEKEESRLQYGPKVVNVNNVLVPEDTTLADGDWVSLSPDLLTSEANTAPWTPSERIDQTVGVAALTNATAYQCTNSGRLRPFVLLTRHTYTPWRSDQGTRCCVGKSCQHNTS